MGLIGKLRKKNQDLLFRWKLYIILFVLPLNILLFWSIQMMSSEYRKKELSNYQAMLDYLASDVSSAMETASSRFQNLISLETLGILEHGGEDSAMDMVSIKKNMVNAHLWEDSRNFYYIWNRNADILTIFGRNRDITVDMKEILEEQIKKEAEEETALFLSVFDDQAFLIQNYYYSTYCIGFIQDMKGAFFEFAVPDEGCLLLMNSDGEILYEFNAQVENPDKKIDYQSEKDGKILLSDIGSNGYRIALWMEKKGIFEEVPLLLVVFIFISVASFLVVPVMIHMAKKEIFKPVFTLVQTMGEVEKGDLSVRVPEDSGNQTLQIKYLFQSYNHMIAQLEELIRDKYEREVEKLKTDVLNMQLSVNQHMVLNFLNTIYSLSVIGENRQVESFTQLLMKHFDYVLRRNRDLVTVKEEAEFCENFLKLQAVRFPGCYTYTYSISEEAQDLLIPQLLLQNLVENAVKYALKMGETIEIIFSATVDDEKLILSVCDTGNGMKADICERLNEGKVYEDQNGYHIGLWNCRRRLAYYYDEQYCMNITSRQQEGTQVYIRMPAKRNP